MRGTAALDGFMIIGVLAADPAARWAVAVAVTASAARLGFSARLLRPVLAQCHLVARARVGRRPDSKWGISRDSTIHNVIPVS